MATTTTQISDPWAGLQPYLSDLFANARGIFNSPPQQYPGQTFVGPTAGQLQGWDTQLNYADQVFGGANAPKFDQATGALSNALTGNTNLGALSNATNPLATSVLNSAFTGGAPNIGRYGFSTTLNPAQYTPTFGQAGGLDATNALQSALSGQPDYAGVQASIKAANQPLLDQLNNEIIPGLNSKATFLNNGTGGIKTLNRVLPQVENQMSQNAAALTEQERNRALSAQQQAAGLVSQGGLAANAQGLQGATTAANLGQNLANLNLQTDLGQANALGDYRSQALGLGGLGGNLASGTSSNMLQGISQFPSLSSLGALPGQLSSQFADWGAGQQQQALNDQISKFNFAQQQPQNMLNWYSGILNGMGNLGGTTTTTQTPSGSSQVAGGIGGALAGATLGGYLGGTDASGNQNPWYQLGGGLLGGLAGYFGG